MQRPVESRRFNAVLLSHPSLRDSADHLDARWRDLMSDRVSRPSVVTGWNWCHAKHVSPTNFYSPAIAGEGDLQAPGGFMHDVVIAAPVIDGSDEIFIAAPYVYFLQDLLRRVESRLGQPRPYYKVVALGLAFKDLADPKGEDPIRVRQFSVQHRRSSSADRLSVSGRNPLRSDLGQQFAINAGESAFGMRIEAAHTPEFKTNVNLDRHGNYWWFHRGEGSLQNVLGTLDALRIKGYFKTVRSIPPDHKEDE